VLAGSEPLKAGPREHQLIPRTLRFAELSGVRPMIENASARKSGAGLLANDEREDRVPRRSDDVTYESGRKGRNE
jgi:hypothetical protein